jgi:hypothetical protein
MDLQKQETSRRANATVQRIGRPFLVDLEVIQTVLAIAPRHNNNRHLPHNHGAPFIVTSSAGGPAITLVASSIAASSRWVGSVATAQPPYPRSPESPHSPHSCCASSPYTQPSSPQCHACPGQESASKACSPQNFRPLRYRNWVRSIR